MSVMYVKRPIKLILLISMPDHTSPMEAISRTVEKMSGIFKGSAVVAFFLFGGLFLVDRDLSI